ncbi:TonB-dependent siderophore receptor [Pseudochelatococcus sp. B33]
MERNASGRASNGKGRTGADRGKRGLACLLITSAILGSASFLTPAAAPAQQQGAGQTVSFDIPAQPLSAAIAAFIRATGWEVGYTSQAVADKRSAPVMGTMTPAQALQGLLAGTGVSARISGPSTAALVAAPAGSGAVGEDGSLILDTITVEGQGDGTRGVVATRSSFATKTDTPIMRIPQTINVVTRDEMEVRGVQDFNTAVAYTPGVRVIDYPGGQGAPSMYLRGFRAVNFLGLYRDGLRGSYSTYDANIETFGVERIDVLKGPSSVLYGQGTPGGIINMVSKRPTDTPVREIQLQAGNYSRLQGAVDFGGPIDPERKFLYRFTGLVRDSDTQVDFTPDDRIYLAPALTWNPTPDTSLTLLGNYARFRNGGSEQSFPIYGTVWPNPNGKIPTSRFFGEPDFNKEDIENTSIGYDFRHSFNSNWTLRSNARYLHSSSDYQTTGGSGAASLVNNRYMTRTAQKRDQTSDLYQIDTNLEGKFSTGPLEHTLLLGVDYADYYKDEARRNGSFLNADGSVALFDVFNPVYGQPITWSPTLNPAVTSKMDSSQFGLYVQDQVRLDNWFLLGGLRYDKVKTDVNYYLANTKNTYDDSAYTWRAGLGYEFEFGLTPYVSYTTSFVPQVYNKYGGGIFDPAEGKQLEAGIKYQPVGSNSMITVSAFDIRQTNQPVASPTLGVYYQTGEVHSRGIEVEGKASLSDNFAVIGSYTYLDAKVSKDNPPAGVASKKGNLLEAVPRHTAALWANYTFRQSGLRGLGLGAGVRYVGASYDGNNLNKIPGYTLVDLSVSYDFSGLDAKLDGLKLAVNVNNLFDKIYWSPGFYTNTVKAGNRRTVFATLSYKW